ncbi:hypothetical protein GCM10009603_55100 [Nocardiopsis exhalans]
MRSDGVPGPLRGRGCGAEPFRDSEWRHPGSGGHLWGCDARDWRKGYTRGYVGGAGRKETT